MHVINPVVYIFHLMYFGYHDISVHIDLLGAWWCFKCLWSKCVLLNDYHW